MASYISSNDNRLYAAAESEYGQAAELTAAGRLPAVKLAVKQQAEEPQRRDRTGTRTFLGSPAGLRRRTTFALRTYLTSLAADGSVPGYGSLFAAGLGAPALTFSGGTISSASGVRLQFASPHGLAAGHAVSVAGEIRFVAAIVDTLSVDVNAPFSTTPAPGTPAGRTVTYMPGEKLGSVTLYDYWSPAETVQRIVTGAAVDRLAIKVNADYHEFEFAGPARDLIDSATFESGQAGLAEFRQEPDSSSFDYSIVPGHLGQVWLGAAPDRFFTLTEATVKLDNHLDLRMREFGLDGPRCVVPGPREVTVDMELLALDDAQSAALYQASKQRSPIQAMIQLGRQAGQLMGVYLKSVVAETPELDDAGPRVAWKFKGCRAQGSGDDEIVVAFG